MSWTEPMAACARWVVGGGSVPALGGLDDAEWQQLLADARRHRMVGAVAVAVMEDGAALSARRHDELAELEEEWAAHTLRAERTTLAVVRALDAAGIDARVLKGSAFAHRHWPAPEMRVFGDADVLVRSADLDRAVSELRDRGAGRLVPQVRRGFDRRFGKSVTMRSEDGVEIDLHRTLVAGPHAVIVPEEDLWSGVQRFDLVGISMRCLPRHLQLVHAAVHAVASRSPRLASLVDVALVGSGADLDRAAATAERWRMRPMVREAGTRLATVVGDDDPVVTWAAGLPATAEEEDLYALFVGEASFRRAARATVPHIPRRRDRLRFLASLALPSRAHRRAQG